jgi:hypothetical protein
MIREIMNPPGLSLQQPPLTLNSVFNDMRTSVRTTLYPLHPQSSATYPPYRAENLVRTLNTISTFPAGPVDPPGMGACILPFTGIDSAAPMDASIHRTCFSAQTSARVP